MGKGRKELRKWCRDKMYEEGEEEKQEDIEND